MDQDQAQYWLWLLEASESPPLPQHYCNDMIMSSSRFHMEPACQPFEQCQFYTYTPPLTNLQQAQDWSLQSMNPDSYAITTSQLLSDLSRSYTCLQDTRASLATDTANYASLVGNHPGSPEYHSDIGNLASLHLNDFNSSPRPSQGPLQRRASYSAFQHQAICDDTKENDLVKHTCPPAHSVIGVSTGDGLETNMFCDLAVGGNGDLVKVLQTHRSTTCDPNHDNGRNL
ncbi:hypothetical protein D6D23_07533 [Aureobasidium pullulans]|nr:hypothetical protein D6D23_07533 [Aureobasidium pullulans]